MHNVYPAAVILLKPMFWIVAVEKIREIRKAGWKHAVHELFGLLYPGRILFTWECETETGLDYPDSDLDFWRKCSATDLVKLAAEYFINGDDGPPILVAPGVRCYLFVEEGQIVAHLNGTLPVVMPPPLKAEPWRGTSLPAPDSGKVVVKMLRRVVVQLPAEQTQEPEPVPVKQIESSSSTQLTDTTKSKSVKSPAKKKKRRRGAAKTLIDALIRRLQNRKPPAVVRDSFSDFSATLASELRLAQGQGLYKGERLTSSSLHRAFEEQLEIMKDGGTPGRSI